MEQLSLLQQLNESAGLTASQVDRIVSMIVDDLGKNAEKAKVEDLAGEYLENMAGYENEKLAAQMLQRIVDQYFS